MAATCAVLIAVTCAVDNLLHSVEEVAVMSAVCKPRICASVSEEIPVMAAMAVPDRFICNIGFGTSQSYFSEMVKYL